MAVHPRWIRRFLSGEDFVAITKAIVAAEALTSAELRVHVERRVPRRLFRRTPGPIARARHVFERLGMHRTAERHGVLIYLAAEDRKLAVVGDAGIHARVGDALWRDVSARMVERLRQGTPRAAITDAIEELGHALATHYPRRPDDRNELSDQVTVS
jgi:uncharacterized membrane protein